MRFSSHWFFAKYDHTFPEHASRMPRDHTSNPARDRPEHAPFRLDRAGPAGIQGPSIRPDRLQRIHPRRARRPGHVTVAAALPAMSGPTRALRANIRWPRAALRAGR
jgi:hypothetical protein